MDILRRKLAALKAASGEREWSRSPTSLKGQHMEAVYGTAMLCILAGAVLVLIYGWEPE
jgi:hypothetical protein